MIKNLTSALRSLEKRTIAIAVGVFLVVLAFLATAFAQLLTDWWWFKSLGFGSVWSSIFWTKFVLVFVFSTLFAAFLWINLYVADRVAPPFRFRNAQGEYLVERYRLLVSGRPVIFRTVVSVALGFLVGSNSFTQWEKWILFRESVDFGFSDPVHGKDASFYIFTLPFYNFLADWFFAALLLTLLVSLGAHFLNGTLSPSSLKLSASRGFKIHISALLAGLAVVRAFGYYLDRFDLLLADNGGFDGAMATDVTVRLPGLMLLLLISLFSVGLLIANVRQRGWGLAFAAVAVWGISHVAIAGIFPAIYQRFRVDPVRTSKEAPHVEHNIAATRFAYGLDGIDNRSLNYEPGLQSGNIAAYDSIFSKVPLVDPDRAVVDFNANQTERGFYRFQNPLDVGRYEIDGESRPVVFASRDLDLGKVDSSWEDQHVLNTHGYGLVIAAADDNSIQKGSTVSHPLDYQIRGLGEEDQRIDEEFQAQSLAQPRIYFSDGFDGYAVVGADTQEIDYQTKENETVRTSFSGSGGVPMGSFFQRAAFALRFREIDPLISSSLTSDSKVLMNRDIKERVKTVAPFLDADADPYAVVAEDKVFWVLDMYTTSQHFPYSQSAQNLSVSAEADLAGNYNYVRNSVKAVVNAYNGDISLYIFDSSDPMITAWSNAFPSLFTEKDQMPEELRSHIRYPKDIFKAQTDVWSRYVVDNPESFIQQDTRWAVAKQPGNLPVGDEKATAGAASIASMKPQYVFNRLPAAEESSAASKDEYLLQRFFVPKSGSDGSGDVAKHLTSIMMARSDWDSYGELVQIKVPPNEVQAPDIADTEIRKYVPLTEYNKDKEGNKIDFGEMNMVLAGENIVYVRSVYAESGGGGNIPELERVVAITGDNKRSMGKTLEEAIAGLVGEEEKQEEVSEPSEDVPTPVEDPSEGDSTEEAPTSSQTVFGGLEEAKRLFAEADALLTQADEVEKNGDVEGATELRQEAQEYLVQGTELLGG